MSTTDRSLSDGKNIRGFFDAIAERYDLANHVLSFNLDEVWRERARDRVLKGGEKTLLDVGCGTGKLLERFLEARIWDRAVGIDFSNAMLVRAQQKLPTYVNLIRADFHELPFCDACFDVVVSGFTLRSVKNLEVFFSEILRVLNPGGKAAFLCLTRPTDPMIKKMHAAYLRYYVPIVGKIIAGSERAYRFLSESIQGFQDSSETVTMMQRGGFRHVGTQTFTKGIVTLIYGDK